MAKQKGGKGNAGSPEEQARRKFDRGREKLRAAQEKYMRAVAKGEGEVTAARKRADDRTARARKQVEAQQEKVNAAEARLLQLTAQPRTPDEVGDLLVDMETREEDSADRMPELAAEETASPMGDRESRALEALRQIATASGATSSEWRLASGMPETTFLRARRALLTRGLVRSDGAGGRGARYLPVASMGS